MVGQKRFDYFRLGRHSGFSKVTRCKNETLSGRYRRNGYVHLRETGRLSGRLREQASLLQRKTPAIMRRRFVPGQDAD